MGPGPRGEKKEAQKCAEAVGAILIQVPYPASILLE